MAVATIVAGVPAILFIGTTVRSAYRRTVGRRKDIYRRLARLGNGAQLSFFSSVLGEEPAVRRTVTGTEREYHEHHPATEIERVYTESFWVDSDYYVQTITDSDETVIAFSITSRRRRFKPTLVGVWNPSLIEAWQFKRRTGTKYEALYNVTLGKTRIDRAYSGGQLGQIMRWGTGARTHQYSEAHYAGNPGHYQTFVLTNSSTSRGVGPFDFESLNELGGLVGPDAEGWQPDPEAAPGSIDYRARALLERFRRNTAVTTFTIIGPSPFRDAEWMPEGFGPHEDLLRTLP